MCRNDARKTFVRNTDTGNEVGFPNCIPESKSWQFLFLKGPESKYLRLYEPCRVGLTTQLCSYGKTAEDKEWINE